MARDSERTPRRIRTNRIVRPATYVASAFLALVVLGHAAAAAPDRAQGTWRS